MLNEVNLRMVKFFLVFLFFLPGVLFAQNSKMKELAEQKRKAMDEIQVNDLLLKETKINTASLMNRIQLVDSQIEVRKNLLNLLSDEMQELGNQQTDLNSQIGKLTKDLDLKKENYEKVILEIIRNNNKSFSKLTFMLSGESMTQMFQRFLYLKDYSAWIKTQAEEIRVVNKNLEQQKMHLEASIKQQKNLMDQYDLENAQLKKEETEYQAQLKEAKSKEKELNAIIIQKKKFTTELDKKIEQLVVQEIEKQNQLVKKQKQTIKSQAQAKPPESQTQAPTTGKTPAVTANEVFGKNEKIMSSIEAGNIKMSANFANNKGKLPYPITGKYSVVGHFGNQKQSVWVTTNKGGIDIQSQANAQARAVFAGQVSKIFAIPGYGTCILVRHGEYFTFYGNIKDIHVKQDDKVDTGQILGAVFTDPNTNIAEMHFQIWKEKQKLNPELWLRK